MQIQLRKGSQLEIIPDCQDDLNPMPRILQKTEGETIQRRRPCEDGGRDWNYIATSPGAPGATRGCHRQGRSSPRALESVPCGHTWISDPQKPGEKNSIILRRQSGKSVTAASVNYGSPLLSAVSLSELSVIWGQPQPGSR